LTRLMRICRIRRQFLLIEFSSKMCWKELLFFIDVPTRYVHM
jgi:hypothetical protein